jgi:hypothetical protein
MTTTSPDKEGHMMDSVPFLFFTLAHEEQLFLDALRIRLRSYIDLAEVRGVLCLGQLVSSGSSIPQ